MQMAATLYLQTHRQQLPVHVISEQAPVLQSLGV